MLRLVTAIAFIFCSSAFGATSNKFERWMISGFYGVGVVSPGDVNNLASSQSTSPKLNSVTSETVFGGRLGYFFSQHFSGLLAYEVQDAKNPVNTNVGSGSGYEMMQNEIWALANYNFFRNAHFYTYAGGGVGYPVYAHLTQTLSTATGFDADKTIGYRGQLGVGLLLGSYFSIFIEGRYQYLVSGDIKNNGAPLTLATGVHAKMDLSGIGGLVGAAVLF